MQPYNQLQGDVIDELNWEPSLDAKHIGVVAAQGIVTLTGHVNSYAEKYAAGKAASRVKGVKAVAEEIEVRLPFEHKRGDDDIAAAIVDRLAWDTFIPDGAIKVMVDDGWVTLSGEVSWHYQKSAAEQEVRGLTGVVGVSNQVTITPAAGVAEIGKRITDALHRSWILDGKTIRVIADKDGEVHLNGIVRSLRAREIAAAAAWAAPGTTNVDNNIVIA